jgi:general secretion pathway protein D
MTPKDGVLHDLMNTLSSRVRRRRSRCGELVVSAVVTTAALVGLTGCAGYQAFNEGQSRLADGQTEQGLAMLNKAMELEPRNSEYRRTFFTQRESLLNGLLREAELALESGNFALARQAYENGQRVDPASKRVAEGVGRVDVIERHWKAVDAAAALGREGKLEAAIAKSQQVLSENPNYRRATVLLRQLMRQQADVSGKELGIHHKLKAAYRAPVSLSFTNASLLQVFEALKLASGLNYVIERDVKPDLRVTISVTNKPVEDILRLLLATNQLERRVLDEDTLLIYPNTAAKLAEYRELVVRTFYLNNADATKMANAVRTIAKARDVVVDEKLNMLMVRDSAEVIRLAEKLIAAQDLPEPEVMLDLEVLEVSVSRLLQLGIRWPDSVSAGVMGASGVAGQLRLDELRNRSSDMVRLSISDPVISAQLRSTKGDANLLANPRIRVKSKQAAKILIGERVPVITTTSTPNVGTSNSVSYLDVGLKLDIEPTVSLDDEVSMKIALEVSNILETITGAGGTTAYRLGTRNTSTSLRVRDGETNILAGLIQRDERRSNTGVPGLNEIPVVSKLFGAAQDSDSRTEIVLLITPRIVRNLDVPGVGLQEFLAGTEGSVGAAPIQLGQPGAPVRPASSPPSGQPGSAPSAAPSRPAMAPSQQPGTPGPTAPSSSPAAPVPFTPPPLIPSTPVRQ